VKSTYETIEGDKENLKLIVTLNNVYYEKTGIIHTKLVFYTDNKKRKLNKDFFHYLHDINCKFKKVSFTNLNDLEKKINDIFDKRKFGEDMMALSDLNVTLTSLVNKWLKDKKIDTFSIYSITYNPVKDVIPCEALTFQFEINIDDTRFIKMIMKKINDGNFKISFNENDWFEDIDIGSLKALPQTIGEMVKKHILK